jgi:hypothetical protein
MVEFVSHRMLRSIHDTVVLTVHGATGDKSNDTKHSFYEKLEHILNQFHTYHIKILLEGFNGKKYVF